jgi:chemotaxis signal transduction protein
MKRLMSEHGDSVKPQDLVRQDDTLDGGAILRLLDRPLTAEELHEATARVARPLEPPEKDVVRLLLVRVGDEELAFPARDVAQVTGAASVHRIPHRTNKTIRGLCNVDGDLMLCADLAALLEVDVAATDRAEANEQRRMVVLGDEAHRWVVEVDAVKGVLPVSPHTYQRPPITVAAALGRYTAALVPLDGGALAALLDAERLIAGFQAALS